MAIPTTSDREILIQLDSNVQQLKDSINRLGDAIEKLEETKIKDHEDRLSTMEKWHNEWAGAYKAGLIISLLLGIYSAVKNFFR
jgi:hypothetical protein